MKLLMGIFIFVSLAFLSAEQIQAQPAPAQQKKLNILHLQIVELRGEIKQETAKLNAMNDHLIALQTRLRETLENVMGSSIEVGSAMPIVGPKDGSAALGAAGSQNIGPVQQ